MNIEILLFGRLTEIIGQDRLQLANLCDTDSLGEFLHLTYPALAALNYKIAVDQQIIHQNTALTDGMTVAIMPPFSGG